MKCKRVDIIENGSCNACNKSKLREGSLGLEYPYKTVHLIKTDHISIRFCDDCLIKLGEYIKNIEDK